jgi:zinc transport system substrate-binding protein
VIRLVIRLCLLYLLPAGVVAAVPRVVVSIAPLHSLVTGVMKGVGTPELLVKGNASPHGLLLKPSQVIAVQRAAVIVWADDGVEAFMPRLLATLPPDKHIIKVATLPGITRLPARDGGVWSDDNGDDGNAHSRNDIDGHLWLDPGNARVIVAQLSVTLGRLDPQHATAYRANAARVKRRLTELDQALKRRLAPVRTIPYLVFHDAYQYFERRYRLNPVGAIMVDPEHKPGARRLADIRMRIKNRHIHCVFSEPQFSNKLPDILVAGTGAHSATLDPLGLGIPDGEDQYFDMMLQLGHDLAACLAAD